VEVNCTHHTITYQVSVDWSNTCKMLTLLKKLSRCVWSCGLVQEFVMCSIYSNTLSNGLQIGPNSCKLINLVQQFYISVIIGLITCVRCLIYCTNLTNWCAYSPNLKSKLIMKLKILLIKI
jgi:hypothetical protein